MEKLSQLLHELVEHAVPQGNKRGELHGLVDDIVSLLIDKVTPDSAPGVAEPAQTGDAAQS